MDTCCTHKLTSAVHTPAGNLNLNVLSLSFHTPKALPAVATFTFVEDGTEIDKIHFDSKG